FVVRCLSSPGRKALAMECRQRTAQRPLFQEEGDHAAKKKHPKNHQKYSCWRRVRGDTFVLTGCAFRATSAERRSSLAAALSQKSDRRKRLLAERPQTAAPVWLNFLCPSPLPKVGLFSSCMCRHIPRPCESLAAFALIAFCFSKNKHYIVLPICAAALHGHPFFH
ncbi:MAG TPA: hypothetical protein PK858_00020, partial [Saprospiraceae bacterium]|nr:hypothetical protein [Saprospiraceae bacterium]